MSFARLSILLFCVWGGFVCAQPKADFTFTDSVCGDKTVKFNNLSTNATKFFWQIGSSFQTTTNPSYTFDSFKTYTVLLIASDNSGLSDTIKKDVHLFSLPFYKISSPPPNICPGDSINLLVTYNVNYKYNWSPSKWLDDSLTNNPKCKPYKSISYYIRITDTTTNCQSVDSLNITVKSCNPPKSYFVNNPVTCGNFKVTFKNRSIRAYKYLWNFGDPQSGTSDTSTTLDSIVDHLFSGPGTYKVSLIAYDSLDLIQDTFFVSIGVNNPIVASILNSNSTICLGDSILLSTDVDLNNGGQIIWRPNEGIRDSTSKQVYVTPSQTTKYWLIYYKNGCVDSTNVLVSVVNIPKYEILFDTTCLGSYMNLTTSPPLKLNNFIWNFGDNDTSTETSPKHKYLNTGNFLVTLKVVLGNCIDSSKRIVVVKPKPEINFNYEPKEVFIDKPIVNFIDLSKGVYKRIWDFGDGVISNDSSISHHFDDTGYYQISLISIDTFGCSDTLFHWVLIRPNIFLYVPTAFTPNREGPLVNETFQIYCNDRLQEFKFVLYNRWGEKVFESNDQNFIWNGFYRDKPIQEGLYLWRMNYRISSEKGEIKTGELFIYR